MRVLLFKVVHLSKQTMLWGAESSDQEGLRCYNWITILSTDLVCHFLLNSIETTIEIVNCSSPEDTDQSIASKIFIMGIKVQ